MSWSRSKSLIFLISGFLSGLLVSYVFHFNTPHVPEPSLAKIYYDSSKYIFTKPSLGSEIGNKEDFPEYKPMEDKVAAIIKEDPNLYTGSFYLRNLNNGRWTGVNENQTFSPASLMKVPLMMVYYKIAETKPEVLQTKYQDDLSEDDNKEELIKPSNPILAGQYYTVDELIRRMIVQSDNNAALVLNNHIDPGTLSGVFSNLYLNLPQDQSVMDFVSAKQYSLVFRALYNSSYLSPQMSERALKLLSEVEFKDGLVAGTGGNELISHKFGERNEINGTNVTNELHDCGILYLPDNPHLLCVMTKGSGNDNLKSAIQKITSAVYDEIKQIK
jgi:beta-lactamase class A